MTTRGPAPFIVAAMLLALTFGGVSRARAQAQDGGWTGTTSQGRGYTFTVHDSGTRIQPLRFEFAVSGCTGSVTINSSIAINGNTFTSSGGACIVFSTNGTFNSPTSASGSVSFTANPNICPCSGSGSATWSATAAPPAADLALTMTDGRTTAVPGAPLAYTLRVTNNGPSTVGGVTLTDTVPLELQGVVFTPSAGSYEPSTGAWSGLALSAGQNVTLTLSGTVHPAATGSITNTASVTPVGVDDPNGANNSASDTNTLTPQANLAILKTGPGGIFPPASVAYLITVTNLGPSNASGASVSDTTPPGLTFLSNAGHCTTPFPCTLGPIPAGEKRTITATYDVPGGYAGPDPIQNTASVSGTTPDPDSTNNSWTVASLVNPASRKFHTVSPCRLVDTRGAFGPLGGPALLANQSRTLPLTGVCNIPATAKALAVNVTATAATSPGNLRLYPGGFPLPLASAINYAAARARANNAVALLGVNGDLSVRCDQASGTVHLILDVYGYYE